jgi:hypothetical protein
MADGTGHIFDYKYGKGVKVNAKQNSQMRIYALGADEAYWYEGVYKWRLHIVQPRIDHFDSETVHTAALRLWGEEVLAPAVRAASDQDAPLRPSETACRWCRARRGCSARARYFLEQDFGERIEPKTLDAQKVAKLLPRADELCSWANDLRQHAMALAVEGAKLPGWKLVHGRTQRAWTATAPAVLSEKLGDKAWRPAELIGISEAERLLGRAAARELMPTITERSESKPSLVTDDDPRPDWTLRTNAANDFLE